MGRLVSEILEKCPSQQHKTTPIQLAHLDTTNTMSNKSDMAGSNTNPNQVSRTNNERAEGYDAIGNSSVNSSNSDLK